jgi:RNA polymerase sigma factor (TIGR02999 family)
MKESPRAVERGSERPESGVGDPESSRYGAVELLPLVYDELRRLAAQRLAREPAGQTLQATALVHEAYLRLYKARHGGDGFANRAQFFAAAAEAMRRILVDRARERAAGKRGGRLARHDLDYIQVAAPEPAADLLAVDEALARFEAVEPSKAALVKLRYFAGMSIPEAADALGISTTTADRYWAFARAWLHAELAKGDSRYGK